jgi:hypothetical protein
MSRRPLCSVTGALLFYRLAVAKPIITYDAGCIALLAVGYKKTRRVGGCSFSLLLSTFPLLLRAYPSGGACLPSSLSSPPSSLIPSRSATSAVLLYLLTFNHNPSCFSIMISSLTLLLAFSLSAAQHAHAKTNDWSKGCFHGDCSYDVPSSDISVPASMRVVRALNGGHCCPLNSDLSGVRATLSPTSRRRRVGRSWAARRPPRSKMSASFVCTVTWTPLAARMFSKMARRTPSFASQIACVSRISFRGTKVNRLWATVSRRGVRSCHLVEGRGRPVDPGRRPCSDPLARLGCTCCIQRNSRLGLLAGQRQHVRASSSGTSFSLTEGPQPRRGALFRRELVDRKSSAVCAAARAQRAHPEPALLVGWPDKRNRQSDE